MAEDDSAQLGSNLADLINATKAQALNMGALADVVQQLADALSAS
jgi:hypothetical protein